MGTLLESGEPWFAAAETLLVGVAVALAVGIALRLLARRVLRDEDRAQRTAMVAFWGVVAVFGLAAVSRLLGGAGAEAGLTAASNRLYATLPDLVVALVIVIVGAVLASAARAVLLRRLAQGRPRYAEPAAATASTGIVVVAVLLAARQVGIATALAEGIVLAVVAAALLAAALATGLGGRSWAGAYAAGRHALDILTVGDLVEVDGRRGRVLRLGPTSVRLGLDHGVIAEVPNTALLAQTVTIFEHTEEPGAEEREAAAEAGVAVAAEVDDEAPTRGFEPSDALAGADRGAPAGDPGGDRAGDPAEGREGAPGTTGAVEPDPTRVLEPGWRQRAEAARAAIARAEAEHAAEHGRRDVDDPAGAPGPGDERDGGDGPAGRPSEPDDR